MCAAFTPHCAPGEVKTVAVLSTGLIGSGWCTLFLAHGFKVRAYDISPQSLQNLNEFVRNAWPTASRLAGAAAPNNFEQNLSCFTDAAEALRGVQFVQEACPDRANIKSALYEIVEQELPSGVVCASSTSALTLGDLQAGRSVPGRFIVGHPFNPPHILPLVEVVGSDEVAVEWAMQFYALIGKQPVKLLKEKPGHIANRLCFALYQEAVALVAEGVATVEDVDKAIVAGPGPRWALYGPHMTYHLGGGEQGIKGFLEHVAPERMWPELARVEMNDEIRQKIAAGVSDGPYGGIPVSRIAQQRDHELLRIIYPELGADGSEVAELEVALKAAEARCNELKARGARQTGASQWFAVGIVAGVLGCAFMQRLR